MEITQLSMTLGGAGVLLTLIGTILTIYRMGIRPSIDRADRERMDSAIWRNDVNNRMSTFDRRFKEYREQDSALLEQGRALQVMLHEVLQRLTILETQRKMERV